MSRGLLQLARPSGPGMRHLWPLGQAGHMKRDTVQHVQQWSASQWCACANRDLWESIAFLLDEYAEAGTSFAVFHNKAHPENWQTDMQKYSALEQVANITDAVVGMVKEVVEERPVTPDLPGRNRWKLWHNGMEVIGPVTKSMQNINRLTYILIDDSLLIVNTMVSKMSLNRDTAIIG